MKIEAENERKRKEVINAVMISTPLKKERKKKHQKQVQEQKKEHIHIGRKQ